MNISYKLNYFYGDITIRVPFTLCAYINEILKQVGVSSNNFILMYNIFFEL